MDLERELNPGPRIQLRRLFLVVLILSIATIVMAASLIPMTLDDFHVPGTQVGDVSMDNIRMADECALCHGYWGSSVTPYQSWRGSLMANAGRDPLFFAQMATANQDVANVGYYCMRCHVPLSIVSGHANTPDGSSLDYYDQDGVSCHFCHSMVDPIYKPGISPVEDLPILSALNDVPQFYTNAAFVLDPSGTRRGPRQDAQPLHELLYSPFHTSGDFCGTCHDVGNVAVTLQPDGTYRYNTIGEPSPTQDPWMQFPLERTYTEWKLSAFANGGVDMGGLFGGENVTVVSSCQDCHMPRAAGYACDFGPKRPDVAQHDFAGAAVSVLDMIAEHYKNDPAVDPAAIAVARAKALSMLERSAELDLEQMCGSLQTRVYNNTGHKLPTGHIEGRRVWVNVQFYDESDALVREYGHYDSAEAHLDEDSTEVYEMHVGLSPYAAQLTGYPAGPTGHMALADTIVKDNRIPPRGFTNDAFEAGGAPVVAAHYADGQYWDDSYFSVPDGACRVEVYVYYQNLPRHYIEELRDGNTTNHWGNTLYSLWESTGKGPPILITSGEAALATFTRGDLDCDGRVGVFDLLQLFQSWTSHDSIADINGDRHVDVFDLFVLLSHWQK